MRGIQNHHSGYHEVLVVPLPSFILSVISLTCIYGNAEFKFLRMDSLNNFCDAGNNNGLIPNKI